MSENMIMLYVANKKDRATVRSYEEVYEEFKNSNYYDRAKDENDIYIRDALSLFIADKEYLNCTYDLEDFDPLYEYIFRRFTEDNKK